MDLRNFFQAINVFQDVLETKLGAEHHVSVKLDTIESVEFAELLTAVLTHRLMEFNASVLLDLQELEQNVETLPVR